MSSQRAQANHSLYLAKIQLATWREKCSQEELPASVLSQAFLPAVRLHLLEAYGWFLLTLIDVEPAAGRVPEGVAELPAIPAGKARPGDLNELQRLEQSGWLADLKVSQLRTSPASSRGANLAAAGSGYPGPEEAAQWCQAMSEVIERLGDSLDES